MNQNLVYGNLHLSYLYKLFLKYYTLVLKAINITTHCSTTEKVPPTVESHRSGCDASENNTKDFNSKASGIKIYRVYQADRTISVGQTFLYAFCIYLDKFRSNKGVLSEILSYTVLAN